METYQNTRTIDPFFEHAINTVFLKPEKQMFVMDGSIATGKSSNFLMWGSYQIAQRVEPIKKGNRWIRESLWAGIRESEKSAQLTFLQLLEQSIFSPEIMSLENSPVTVLGSHPSYVRIYHMLPDNTFLDMQIECHGFNNEQAFNRLKTREYMGSIIPEMQGIPWLVVKTASERSGRWRAENNKISKTIDGKTYVLTGIRDLGITMCDVNIPERPHPLYDNCYDAPNLIDTPFEIIRPPSPLLYKPVEDVSDAILDKYPVTRFEGQQVVWIPNPECYGMTKHFERKDDSDNNIPWTGYDIWFREIHRTDSEVRRYVLGIPDTVGGQAAVYMGFSKSDKTVCKRKLHPTNTVRIGFDPGKYAAYEFCQSIEGNDIHYFHEIFFEPSDGVRTRQQLTDFVIPYIKKKLKGYNVVFVPDPAGHASSAHAESPVSVIQELGYAVERCLVPNQDTEARVNCLGYFIEQQLCTIDPMCEMLIGAVTGGYQHKKLKSGVISDRIDKENPYSHPAEAAQYPAVNVLHGIRSNERNKHSKRSIYRIKHVRR